MILQYGKTQDDTGNTCCGRIPVRPALAGFHVLRYHQSAVPLPTQYHVEETTMKKFASILAALALALAGVALAKDEPRKTAAPAAAEKKAEPMDINTASEKDLATLKGIGDVRAKAIVKGRPYKGKNELADKEIISEKVYNDIKDQIIAKQPEKKDEKKTVAKTKK